MVLTDKDGNTETRTANAVVFAVGARPNMNSFPGCNEFCISSDDIFLMEKPPGKTLVVGASVIALEFSGFLSGMGFDTTVMVRSILLRGYDQECAEKIGDFMKRHHTKFIRPTTPEKAIKTDDGKIRIFYKNPSNAEEMLTEDFDTVVVCIGRNADLSNTGVPELCKMSDKGKVVADDHCRTSIPSVYAIGDCVHDRIELTPAAILDGRLLA